MSSSPQDRQSLERKTNDAMLIEPPNPPPDTKSARIIPTKKPGHFVFRPSPTNDDAVVRTERKCNQILRARTHMIRERVAAAAALEYNPADLAKNVKTTKEVIIGGIKNAMVFRPAFGEFHDSRFLVGFKFPIGPATNQTLRAIFPGVGVRRGNGKEKGWYTNVYSCAEFQDLMGTDVIARVDASIAELSGDVAVYCLIQEGDLKIRGMYREMDYYPQLPFLKTAARRR